jgi:C4-dicarboxylate-specific signal transduction histidine kinase
MNELFHPVRARIRQILTSQETILRENVRLQIALQSEMRDRERAEMRARKALDELARVSRIAALSDMGASIAHEVNQPLTAILTFAQAAQRLLGNGLVDCEDIRCALERIASCAGLAGDIIRRLRNFVRKEELQRMPVDVNRLIGDISPLLGLEIRRHDVKLLLDLEQNMPVVLADGIHIQQVMLNLVRNAAEVMHESAGDCREIVIRTRNVGTENHVSVHDSGPGIAPEIADILFDAFVTTKTDGTGIGLAICRAIIEDHGGSIEAQSTPGSGAVFRFKLPVMHCTKNDAPCKMAYWSDAADEPVCAMDHDLPCGEQSS